MRQKTYEKSLKLVGTKGFWRLAWKVDDTDEMPRGPHSIFGADNRTNVIYGNFFSNYPSSVILKTLKYRHNFEEGYYESNRVDAVAMERLTPSPNVVNIYGFCGQSVVTELAASPTLKALISKSNSLGKLGVARDVASGLADVHGIDDHGAKGGTASLVHNDINPSNIVATRGGVPKLNDFNIGVLMTWDEGKNRPCPFLGRYPNAQWRPPEEQWIGGKRSKTPLTEKVDVYALGNIFFGIIAGQDPWRELRSKGGSIGGESKARLAEAKSRGTLPALPDEVRKSHDPSIVAVRDMMMECFRADPEKRPTAEYVARNLTAVLESLAN